MSSDFCYINNKTIRKCVCFGAFASAAEAYRQRDGRRDRQTKRVTEKKYASKLNKFDKY